MDNNKYSKSEIVINFKEVIFDLISQWKALLIVAIFIAVLVTGAKYQIDINAYEAAKIENESANTEASAEERISDILAALPEDEAALVEFLIKQNEWIEEEKEYVNNSILLNTNPALQRTLILDYYISMADPEDSIMTALVYGYAGYLTDEDLINSMRPVIAPDADSKYIAELITINGGNSAFNLTSNPSSDTEVLEVRVVLPDEADAEAVEKTMTSALSDHMKELRSKIGNHSIALLSSSEAYLHNSVAETNQNSSMYAVNNLMNNTKNIKNSLSDGQKAALDSITVIMKESSETAGAENPSSEAQAEPSKPGISKKYALLGFVLGAMIYAFAYVLLLIIRGRVNYASAAEHYTQARLLGEIYQKTEYKGLGALFHSKLVDKYRHANKANSSEQINRLTESLEALCHHKGIQDAAILDLSGDDKRGVLAALAEKSAAKGLPLKILRLADEIDEKMLPTSSHALIVLDAGTKVSKVAKLAALCSEYDVATLGSVFVGDI